MRHDFTGINIPPATQGCKPVHCANIKMVVRQMNYCIMEKEISVRGSLTFYSRKGIDIPEKNVSNC